MKNVLGKATLLVMLSVWSLTGTAQEDVSVANPYNYPEPEENGVPRAGAPGDGGGAAPAINRAVLNDMTVSFEITPETTDLMGESVDLNSGSVSFAATDVSIPGNFDIPVEISRRFHDGNFTFRNTAEFGDWGLELPSIHNTLFYSNAKLQGPWGNGAECSASQQQTPPAYSSSGSIIQADQYWSGLSLNVGGQTEKLLTSTDGSSVYTTKNNWKISCYTRTGGGEGFKAISPNGISYYLDVPHMVRGFMPSYPLAPLYQAYMRVSRIEDRFGNWVNFQYATRVINTNLQSNNLTKITSSDGRTIDLTYAHATQPYLVTSVAANSKTWSYGYDSHNSLQTVTLPDSSAWNYNLWQISHWVALPEGLDDNSCTLSNVTTATGSITHPKGATGTFTLKTTLHGHSDTPLNSDNYGGYKEKKCFQTMALTNKTITGPSVNLSWQYSYSQNKGAYTNETPVDVNVTISNYLSRHLKSTTVLAPDGSITVHVFSRRWDYLAGQKVATLQYDTDGVTLLQNAISTFTQQTPVMGGIYLERTNLAPLQYRALSNKSTITQSTDSFITEYFDYNVYGIPKTIKETNSVNTGWLRCTRRAYMHDTALNVLNQPTTTKVANNTTCATDINDSTYTTTKEVLYYPVSASSGKLLPQATYAFGALQQTYSYNTDGTLAQQTDNVANRWVKFSSYKRGKARTIELPGRYSLTPGLFAYRTINDDGTVASVTDFNGNATSYGYDPVGRVTLVDPANATWANTIISYTVPGGAYALQQSISRGNYRKVVSLDALMRTVLTQEWDAADSSTTRYVNQRFNAYNKAVFSSVPSSSSSETVGSSTTYDGLQRVKQQTNTSEGDINLRYLSGNQVEKTDGRGFITTTAYLAYGNPEQSLATSIVQPGSITTSLSYNLFDNPTSIVQGGVTESRIYDAQQRLCLQKRPDTGIAVYSYNTVGQVMGVAEGLSGAGTSCSGYTNVAAAWITTTYDNIGDIYTQSYADGSPVKTYTLDGQGNVKRLSAGTVVWDYDYNSLHLIEKEILTVDNQSFILDPAYNSLGYQTSQTYPSGTLVNYAPNALGQPTQAGSYATNAMYHPNGQLKSFTYGNGLTFTQNLDTDYRPYERLVKSGTTLRVGQRYGYDASENLQSISDLMNSSKSVSLGFDGLNRLTSAGGYWGSGSLSYDALGNIKTKTLGTQALTYSYDTNNRLTTVTGGYSFSYDGRGTVTNNGKRTFTVNRANQMTSSGTISYAYDGHNRRVKKVNGSTTQYSLYNQSGQFLSTIGANGPTEHIYLGSQLVARVSQVATTDDKPGYTGHLEDEDIGLTYMQQRYYDPVIGRFYSNDPVGVRDTNSFNRYSYANNNPYKFVDPFGMVSEKPNVIERENDRREAECNSDPNCSYFRVGSSQSVSAKWKQGLEDNSGKRMNGNVACNISCQKSAVDATKFTSNEIILGLMKHGYYRSQASVADGILVVSATVYAPVTTATYFAVNHLTGNSYSRSSFIQSLGISAVLKPAVSYLGQGSSEAAGIWTHNMWWLGNGLGFVPLTE
jgi:RHS repeat-associated protein